MLGLHYAGTVSPLDKLGTETAFAVSAAAADWAAKGNKVYPFHLGDINIATPENIVEATIKAIGDGYTGYCAGAGVTELRDAIARDVGSKPGYPIYESQIEYQGGKAVAYDYIRFAYSGIEVVDINEGMAKLKTYFER